MNLSSEQINIIVDGVRNAEDYVQKHTGLVVKCKIEVVETKGQPKQMMSLIAETLGEDVANYYIKTRKRNIVELRMIATVFVSKYYEHLTLLDIARLFGDNNLDHACIIHYKQTVADLIKNPDKPLTQKYRKVQNAVATWIRD